jgi:hypothetical protein
MFTLEMPEAKPRIFPASNAIAGKVFQAVFGVSGSPSPAI